MRGPRVGGLLEAAAAVLGLAGVGPTGSVEAEDVV